ncbi:protamine-like protein 99C [Scaptodrosophila lebanonensis]|uniref:Protamine-like protein 99C n=1 Tax=Drosophila lebanonensis TaxID=7225 RepID=A0A6J2TR48_DROLE|nr:protamine-like protein 99C [Scaptodrosophila lebanonensis]XP_030377589.1 protamine-like protein 99C [Scaptodrosophila lebanonensis]
MFSRSYRRRPKPMRQRPITNNGFLNYLREFVKLNSGMDVLEATKSGARCWKKLSHTEMESFRQMERSSDDVDNHSICDSSAPELGSSTTNESESLSKTDLRAMDICCPKKPSPPPCCPPKKKKKKPSCPEPPPCCPPPKRKPRCPKPKPRCPKPKPKCKPKKRACPKKKKPACGKRKKCSKPGPVMNNGYLNFIRAYRKKHCGLKPKELIMKAARAWCRLSEEKKNRYRRMACKVTTSCRHKRRRVCTGR